MAEQVGTEMVSEDQIAEVTAKLMQWSATLPEAEQMALASILEAAVGADDTRGHIIIVGGQPAIQPDIIRGGVLRGIFTSGVGLVSNQPTVASASDLNLPQ
jgi:hypothetical protein